MTDSETWVQKIERTAAAYHAAKAAQDAYYEQAWRTEYARRRAEDKAAGRDVSGKSVSGRRVRAMDVAWMSDPVMREMRDATEQAEAAYRAARSGS